VTETAVVEVNSLPSPVVTLEVWAKRRADFNRFVNEQLRRGIDYGEVPGTDKPTLLKPGAEKIMQLYGCAVQLDVTRRDLDVATGHLSMEFTAKGISLATGQMVGMGVGSCSTYESKYRYRWVWWNGGGKPTGDEWEQTRNGKWRRRVENLDLADQWNTVLKMGKKRAMVDLALTISGASERFTQDIEDAVDAPAPETGNGHQEAETHWSDKVTEGRNWGQQWMLKQATERSITTGQVAQMVGDLHQYATHADAATALATKMAEATK
jgi:hypothetical protein